MPQARRRLSTAGGGAGQGQGTGQCPAGRPSLPSGSAGWGALPVPRPEGSRIPSRQTLSLPRAHEVLPSLGVAGWAELLSTQSHGLPWTLEKPDTRTLGGESRPAPWAEPPPGSDALAPANPPGCGAGRTPLPTQDSAGSDLGAGAAESPLAGGQRARGHGGHLGLNAGRKRAGRGVQAPESPHFPSAWRGGRGGEEGLGAPGGHRAGGERGHGPLSTWGPCCSLQSGCGGTGRGTGACPGAPRQRRPRTRPG